MTGRGEGYCALVLPLPEEGRAPYGYAGSQGRPVRLEAPDSGRFPHSRTSGWLPGERQLEHAYGRGPGRRRGRGPRR